MEVDPSSTDVDQISTELWIEQGIRLYVYPAVLLTGLTGNSLSIAILTRPAMRSLPAYTYLTVLSLTDNLVLLAHLLRMWIEAITGYDVSHQHNWACKLKSVIGFTATHYSGWLIVVMTVDRYTAVSRPLQASCYGEKRRTFSIIFFLFIFFLLFNLHFLWTNHLVSFSSEEATTNLSLEVRSDPKIDNSHLLLGIDGKKFLKESQMYESTGGLFINLSNFIENQPQFNSIISTPLMNDDQSMDTTSRYVCDNFEEYKMFYDYFWPWIDSTLHCWAPFIILSVLNFIIATKVVESKKTRNKLTNKTLTSCIITDHSRNFEVSNSSCQNQDTPLRCNIRDSPDPKSMKKRQMISKLKNETIHRGTNSRTMPKKPDSKTSIVSSLNGLNVLKIYKSSADSPMKTECHSGQPRKMKHFPGQTSKRTKVGGDLRLAVMLLVVSFTFLLTTLPVNVFMIVKTLLVDDELYERIEDRLFMWQTICDLLMYSNHAVNFFLYCATGAKFRRQLFLTLSKFGR